MRKRIKRWMALTVAASLCAGSNPQQISLAKEVSDKKASLENTEEGNVFKVELDASGKIVSDNASDLEHRSFSWDNATVYFLLTDRFKNGDKSNDHSYGRGMQADGKTPVEGLDTYTNPGTFHGGDLKGLTEKVEDGYFTDLGVNAIWFTAVYEQIHGYTSGNVIGNNCNTYPDPNGKGFPYYSYHGYWALDYTNVDENWGDEKDFEKFVDACHEKGIRVVMDVVMNHLGYTTMQDAVDYGFDDALKGDWKEYYYGNSTYLMGGDPESLTYWDPSSSAWSKWWGPGFVRADYPGYTPAGGDDLHMSLCGMPDVMTESSAPEVGTPPILKTKWEKEGRLEEEQSELDDYFARTGNKKQARYYIIKWLTDWVREYGVDGFRCDTAKHADLDAWKDLKTEAVDALKEWRKNNTDKPGADWTDDFWMTGECWGHGMSKSPYHTSGGFDSMVNFGFPKNGTPSAMEGTYSAYAAINEDPEWNTLSYINSHDDNDAAKVTWNGSTQQMKDNGTCLLLSPGGAQIYYGNEINRGLGWDDFFTDREYLDQRFRSDMDWSNYDKECLAHWQKVGQFRNKHLSVGAGQHEKLDGDAYTFSRTYHLEEDDEDKDKVVCCLPGKAGTYEVPVGDVFEDGETITDFYSGEKYEVSGGSVSATCDANGVILLEGSGIVKASVGAKAKNKSATYSSDTIDITLKANKAKDTYYQINDGEKKEYKADDVITIGGDTAYEEKTTITLTGISEDDGSELKKEVTYQRSKEPTVSDGEFALKVKKSDFPNGAPTVYAYSNDKTETPYSGKWPGDAMVDDDDSDYYVYKNEKITEDAMFILVSGSWRSTPDMQPGLVARGCMLYDKTANDVTEMPSGEPGKVTINYVDQDGNQLKSIYRVGVVGKKYTTYPAEIDGYRLVEEPDNASGVFETSSEVIYVYAKGDEVVKTQPPKVTDEPEPTDVDKNTEPPTTGKSEEIDEAEKTTEPTKSAVPSTGTPKPTASATVKQTPNPTPKPTSKPTATSTAKPSVKPSPTANVDSGGESDGDNGGVSDSEEKFGIKVTTNKASGQKVKSSITINAQASGGSGNYSYIMYVTNTSTKKVTLLQNVYSSNHKVTWKPTTAGTYKITVTAKDTTNNKITSKSINFTITKPKFSYNNFSVKAVGKQIKMSASVTPGSGNIKYKFVIHRGNKKVKSYGYFSKGTRIYKAKKSGIYKVTMYAKDKVATVYVTKTIKVK